MRIDLKQNELVELPAPIAFASDHDDAAIGVNIVLLVRKHLSIAQTAHKTNEVGLVQALRKQYDGLRFGVCYEDPL